MFGFVARVFGTIISSLCISAISVLFFSLFSSRRTKTRGSILRRFLRASYYLYVNLLGWVCPHIERMMGIDLLSPIPRTLASGSLSFGIGWGVLYLLDWPMGTWLVILCLAHGLFVGWSWERIVIPNDFQMGARFE